MWESLGFRNDPYNTRPLQPREQDIELLIGRDDEAVDFATRLEAHDRGCIIISGNPGVGKTSFFNVQQINLESGRLHFGPRILAARKIYSVKPEDRARDVAMGCLDSVTASAKSYCEAHSVAFPDQLQLLLGSREGRSALTGISGTILGVGGGISRSITVPNTDKAPLEAICDNISLLTESLRAQLPCNRVVICIDNVENLSETELIQLFTAFRDTLFNIENVWVIVIGQSRLSSFIRARSPKVAERISGSIELENLPLEELYEAIAKRVERFHTGGRHVAPLSSEFHQILYNAAHGEMRFTFQQCGEICFRFVTAMRKELRRKVSSLDKLLGEKMAGGYIPDELAQGYLEEIVKEHFLKLTLSDSDKSTLRRICKLKKITAGDFSAVGAKSRESFRRTLARFVKEGLLYKAEDNRNVVYKSRGFSAIATAMNLWDLV